MHWLDAGACAWDSDRGPSEVRLKEVGTDLGGLAQARRPQLRHAIGEGITIGPSLSGGLIATIGTIPLDATNMDLDLAFKGVPQRRAQVLPAGHAPRHLV